MILDKDEQVSEKEYSQNILAETGRNLFIMLALWMKNRQEGIHVTPFLP